MIKDAISLLVDHVNLDRDSIILVMEEIMNGNATPAQISSFLTALRMKGETVEEITGAAMVMREKARKIKVDGDCLDTCGTGGDHSMTFNISTAAALVACGAGLKVAKHGNRAASSMCGSADVLKELGVNIEADIEVVERCLNEIGIGFLFAPLLHEAMKYAIGPRREIGIRTIFNLLGPLTNPAGAKRQLLGVYDEKWLVPLAQVLRNLGSERVMVVHGEDGLDEITITAETTVAELKNGEIIEYRLSPEHFGFKRARLSDIRGGSSGFNAELLKEVLSGVGESRLDIVLLNAGAAIYVGGAAGSIEEGIEKASESIRSGKAREKLEQLIKLSNKPVGEAH